MFSPTVILQLILKDLFLLNHNEKIRGFFTELFFCKNFNFQSLFMSERIKSFNAKKTSLTFNLTIDAAYDEYDIKINYSNKNTIFYSLFSNTMFVPFFLNQKITISKNGIDLYRDGKKTSHYSDYEGINLNNVAYFFTDELQKNAEKFSEDAVTNNINTAG